tara:strand:- start:840 stop:1202 length:363 start_codon:yes stop_codon:yes gene_type:complete
MPPKKEVVLLKLSELKKLMKGYDDLMKVDTKGMSRDELIKKIEDMGYTIDHEKKTLRLTNKKKAMKRKPLNVKMPPPKEKKEKSASEKEEGTKKKHEATIKYILKHKEILNDERIQKLLE